MLKDFSIICLQETGAETPIKLDGFEAFNLQATFSVTNRVAL